MYAEKFDRAKIIETGKNKKKKNLKKKTKTVRSASRVRRLPLRLPTTGPGTVTAVVPLSAPEQWPADNNNNNNNTGHRPGSTIPSVVNIARRRHVVVFAVSVFPPVAEMARERVRQNGENGIYGFFFFLSEHSLR